MQQYLKERAIYMKILVTPTSLQPGSDQKALNILKEFSEDLVFNPLGRPLREEELIPLLSDCDGYIAGLDYITENVLDSCGKLKVISRYGAGCDRVDIEAAKKHHIVVTNTPGANAQAVGELAFGLILCTARKIAYLDSQLRRGRWVRATGVELAGKTLGIIGLGAIGRVVAKCAGGFDMRVLAYDPYIDHPYCQTNGIAPVSFEELIRKADIVSLHLPLNSKTRCMINASVMEEMKQGVIIVNASRGGIIDEESAYEYLKKGKLGGLGLDAFEVEPPKVSPLFELPNVIVTPHTGAHTGEAAENMANMAVKNLIDVLSGKDCAYIVARK